MFQVPRHTFQEQHPTTAPTTFSDWRCSLSGIQVQSGRFGHVVELRLVAHDTLRSAATFIINPKAFICLAPPVESVTGRRLHHRYEHTCRRESDVQLMRYTQVWPLRSTVRRRASLRSHVDDNGLSGCKRPRLPQAAEASRTYLVAQMSRA